MSTRGGECVHTAQAAWDEVQQRRLTRISCAPCRKGGYCTDKDERGRAGRNYTARSHTTCSPNQEFARAAYVRPRPAVYAMQATGKYPWM